MKPQDYEQLWAELETLYFLPLSKGRFAVIDAADAHISLVKWTYVTGGYAIRGGQSGARSVLMHHLVLAPSKNMVIDHKNRCGLDNRRSNIRECTQQQNLFNQRRSSMSGFKGVKKSGNSYTVCLTIDRKSVYLGTCKSAVEAARLYDLHALKHHQEFAALNFPESRADYEAELVKFPNPRGKYRWKTKWLDR